MTYIVESIFPTENLVTTYHKNFSGAKEWAQFVRDEYNAKTDIISEHDYVELHPEKYGISSAEGIPARFDEPDFEQGITIMWIHGVLIQDTVGA